MYLVFHEGNQWAHNNSNALSLLLQCVIDFRQETIAQALSAPSRKRYKHVSPLQKPKNSFFLFITECSVAHLLCRILYRVDKLHLSNFVTLYCQLSTCARGSECERACIPAVRSHDSLHPIGSMQIPLEHTKTVQEFPDPSACWWCNTSSAAEKGGSGHETKVSS